MTLTVTNAPTNGMTVSINGHLRTWTNSVTAANNQIATTNSGNASATNYWLALISYPEANLAVAFASSNQIILTAYAGYSLSVATNAGAGAPSWLTWTTNAVTMTNATIFRYPTNAVGGIERSNAAKSLIDYLNVATDTNAVIATLPQWSNFVNSLSLASLSNYVGLVATNATNFTASCGVAETNYASNLYYLSTNFSVTNWNPWSNTVFDALTWTTNQFGIIANNVNYHDLGDITGNTNSILLTNAGGIKRLEMDDIGLGGDITFWNGDGTTIFLHRGETSQLELKDLHGVDRWQSDETLQDGGSTYIRSQTGNDGIRVMGSSDVARMWTPGTIYNAVYPATLMGTVTNFPTGSATSGTGETALNQFNIPANTFTNVGDSFIEKIGVTFAGAGTYEVKVYVFGDTIFDSGSMTVSSSGSMSVEVECTVQSAGASGSLTYSSIYSSTISVPSILPLAGTETGVDFTSTGACKVGFTGAATSDGIIVLDNVRIAPSSQWTVLP